MKNGEEREVDEIVGWPDAHFTAHRKQFSQFDPPTLRSLLALRSTAQRVENALGSWFARADLTPQKFGVLVVLHAEGEPVSLSELRKYLGTTQANVTGLVAGLERDGYIERRASDEDRRVSFVSLSKSGKKTVSTLLPQYFAKNKVAMKSLTQAEKKTFVSLLEKISSGFAEFDD